jgi:hypothetical protein
MLAPTMRERACCVGVPDSLEQVDVLVKGVLELGRRADGYIMVAECETLVGREGYWFLHRGYCGWVFEVENKRKSERVLV